MANPNITYANTFVDELIRSGLKHVVFAPGSRNTPLVLTFSHHKDRIKIWSHLDERSASFFALGISLASQAPTAIICTSGTAGANMFPAIIEAHQSRVPLIVITADRPHELRQSGANQTIDQIKLFGDYALWFVDMPLPEENPSELSLRHIRTTVNRAYATANGIRKGIVHINMPFRKPLEHKIDDESVFELDTAEDSDVHSRLYIGQDHPVPYYLQTNNFAEALGYENGLVIAGVNADYDTFFEMRDIGVFARYMNYPLISDPVSGTRFGTESAIGGYETFMQFSDKLPKPDVVIRFGNMPISKWLNQYIAKSKPKYYIHISPSGEWADDSHLVTHVLHTELDVRMLEVVERESETYDKLYQLEQTTWQVIDDEMENGAYFDGAVVYDVVDLAPDQTMLFAGNSLAVRHLDQFGKPQAKRIYTYANRGASGIDGNTSTALGLGAQYPDRPLVTIMGDITFYHDMNGLLAIHRLGIPITIVLLNNDGGGIFHRLPISQHDPDFTDYFITPHGLNFSHTAKLYGLEYVQVTKRDDFREAFADSVNNRKSMIIEVRTDSKQDLQRRNEIVNAVHAKLATLNL